MVLIYESVENCIEICFLVFLIEIEEFYSVFIR